MALARSLVTTNPRRKSRKPREIQRTEHVNYPCDAESNTLPIGPKGALRSIMCYCAGKNPPLADQKPDRPSLVGAVGLVLRAPSHLPFSQNWKQISEPSEI